MKTSTTCNICGKIITKGFICEECEKEILERGKSKRYALTLLTTLLLIFVLFFMWSYYKSSETEFAKVKSKSDIFLAIVASVAKSPLLILLGVVIFFTVFYYFSTKSARRRH